jgi:hypothetical protein
MLKFAGVPLSLADPGGRVQAWIDRYRPDMFPLHRPTSTLGGRDREQGHWGHSIGLPRPNWEQFPPRWRLNSLWWPTGASRFAVGLFMTTLDGANKIKARVGSDFSGGLEISDGKNSLAFSMYLLQPRPIGAVATDNPVVLIPLVDKRYFWQWSKMGQMFVNPTTTWAQVSAKIVEGLGGATVERPTPTGYENPDWSEWDRFHENAAMGLDAYAASVGQRFVATYKANYKCQKPGDAAGDAKKNLDRFKKQYVAGGELLDMGVKVPEKLVVAFVQRQGGIVAQHGVCNTVTKFASDYGITKQRGGEKVIHTTAQADLSARLGSPSNSAAMSELANVIARDFYGWAKHHYSATVKGVAKDWVLTGFDDYVWFLCGTPAPPAEDCTCDDDEPEEFKADPIEHAASNPPWLCQTLVESFRPNFGVEENTSQFASPSYPRTFRPMPVFRAQLTSDFTGAATEGQLLYDSNFGTGTLQPDPFTVKIFDTMGMRNPETGNGHKVWLSALAADSDMFELIASAPPSATLRVFELLATLSPGGSASARLCNLVGGVYVANGPTITLDDLTQRAWRGTAGRRGYCYLREDFATSNICNLVWMDRKALITTFTATENRTPGFITTTATLDPGWGHGSLFASGGFVVDSEFFYPDILNGARGLAVYDDQADMYEILVVDQMVQFATAQIVNNIDEDSGVDVPISQFTPHGMAFFNMPPNPVPANANNRFKHLGPSGSEVLLVWLKGLSAWVIVDIVKRFKDVPFNIRIKSDKTFIEWEQVKCALEFGKVPQWTDKIALKKC